MNLHIQYPKGSRGAYWLYCPFLKSVIGDIIGYEIIYFNRILDAIGYGNDPSRLPYYNNKACGFITDGEPFAYYLSNFIYISKNIIHPTLIQDIKILSADIQHQSSADSLFCKRACIREWSLCTGGGKEEKEEEKEKYYEKEKEKEN